MSWQIADVADPFGALEAFGAAEQPDYCRCLKACNENHPFQSEGFAAKRNVCYQACRNLNKSQPSCPEDYLDPWNKATAATPAGAAAPAVPGGGGPDMYAPGATDLRLPASGSKIPWLWIGAGAVVLGGAYLLLRSNPQPVPALTGLGRYGHGRNRKLKSKRRR